MMVSPNRSNNPQKRHKQLSALLWLGGLPPVVSGVLASAAPDWYLGLTGVTDVISPAGDQALAFLWHLQGGDAWVAGSARIAVALLGSLMLKRTMVFIMLMHSSYELWLLPTHAFSWCSNQESVCTTLYLVELWAFLSLHTVLIAGSVFVLTMPQRPNERLET
ncbi:hypothetical protein ACFOZ5_01580 [Marinobacter lacisalsi]|uniref:Uncharacterized protein n=1 Tax=Marinobacter lacisalsi TaxID=475979 RepID=A0ABV8QBR4_9GAMM